MNGHPESSELDGLHLGQLGLPNSNSQLGSAATVSSMASYDQDILDEHTSNIRAEVEESFTSVVLYSRHSNLASISSR